MADEEKVQCGCRRQGCEDSYVAMRCVAGEREEVKIVVARKKILMKRKIEGAE